MKKFTRWLVSLVAVLATGAAGAGELALAPGFYSALGTIVSANAACTNVGIVAGTLETGTLYFPGNGNTGLILYGPDPGAMSIATGFQPVPFNGVAGWTAASPAVGTVTIFPALGAHPIVIADVAFTYTAQVLDKNTALVTYTTALPADAPAGGGCVSKTSVSWVRTGSAGITF
jgi:hypothetical protein